MISGVEERYLPVECYSLKRHLWRPRELHIKGIVQHWFSAKWVRPSKPYDTNTCWRLMRDLNFKKSERRYKIYNDVKTYASTQFMIARDGEILQLVPLRFQAFHAGTSSFKGLRGCNSFMVGIENIGGSKEKFTLSQYHANAKLCDWLMRTYRFDGSWITGHSDVARPAGRKKDPGKNFDWELLHKLIREA